MKTQFEHNGSRFEPGQKYRRETSRGWGRDPRVEIEREWTRWSYSPQHRAWVHDGKVGVTHRARKVDIIAAFGCD
jgi:hypothetical protein